MLVDSNPARTRLPKHRPPPNHLRTNSPTGTDMYDLLLPDLATFVEDGPETYALNGPSAQRFILARDRAGPEANCKGDRGAHHGTKACKLIGQLPQPPPTAARQQSQPEFPVCSPKPRQGGRGSRGHLIGANLLFCSKSGPYDSTCVPNEVAQRCASRIALVLQAPFRRGCSLGRFRRWLLVGSRAHRREASSSDQNPRIEPAIGGA